MADKPYYDGMDFVLFGKLMLEVAEHLNTNNLVIKPEDFDKLSVAGVDFIDAVKHVAVPPDTLEPEQELPESDEDSDQPEGVIH